MIDKKEIILEFMKDENYTPMKAKEIARLGVTKESIRIPEKVGKDEYVQMSLFDAVNNDDIIEEIKELEDLFFLEEGELLND